MPIDDLPPHRPPPSTTEGWAIEIATACAAIDEPTPLRLGDGTLLEADDARDAVVLAAIAARDLAPVIGLADVEDLIAALDLETGPGDDSALPVIAARYLALHEAMGLLAEEPTAAWLAAIEQAAAPLIGERLSAPTPPAPPTPPLTGASGRGRRDGGGSAPASRRS